MLHLSLTFCRIASANALLTGIGSCEVDRGCTLAGGFGEIEGEEIKALFDTDLIIFTPPFALDCACNRALPFGTVSGRLTLEPLALLTGNPTSSSTLTSLVVLKHMSVGDCINGGEGAEFEAVEPDRLTGTGTLTALGVSDESEGDCDGRILGSSSSSAAILFISACALTNRCHCDKPWRFTASPAEP